VISDVSLRKTALPKNATMVTKSPRRTMMINLPRRAGRIGGGGGDGYCSSWNNLTIFIILLLVHYGFLLSLLVVGENYKLYVIWYYISLWYFGECELDVEALSIAHLLLYASL
jgi:hypothetical protein